ncbi:MAG: hypothetical protein M1831_006079 [Alyxoria varia]|nr:MAG: hypothetical protein M1831_006079 [Alyxoria varia]
MVRATRATDNLANDENGTRVSSPDPLALSFDSQLSPEKSSALRERSPNKKLYSSPTKRRATTTREPSSPSKASSSRALGTPTKKTPTSKTLRTEDATIGDTIILTPRKRGGKDIPSGQSPRKIKVTVEEMNEDEDVETKNGARVNKIAGTTKVPLNQNEDGSPRPPKRRGGSSKTATQSPAATASTAETKRKRKSTQAQTGGNKRRQSNFVANMNIDDNENGRQARSEEQAVQSTEQHNPMPPKRKRGRPKKSEVEPAQEPQSGKKPSPEKQRAQDNNAEVQPSQEDDSDEGEEVRASRASSRLAGGHTQPNETQFTNANARRKHIDFSQMTPLHLNPHYAHLKGRKDATPQLESPHLRSTRGRIPTPAKPLIQDTSYEHDDSARDLSQENDDGDGHQPSESEMSVNDQASTAQRDQNPALEVDAGMDSESTGDAEAWDTRADDTAALDRSAVESENFSMVSIEALRSQREAAERQVLKMSRQGDSAVSHPGAAHRQNAQTDVAPTQYDGADDNRYQEADSNHRSRSRSSSHLFRGFGTDTRRDLRTGLMVGEYLGRDERNSDVADNLTNVGTGSTSANRNTSLHPSRSSVIPPYPRLPTPTQSSETESRQVSLNDQQHRTEVNEVEDRDKSISRGSNGRKDIDAMSWQYTNPNAQESRSHNQVARVPSRANKRQHEKTDTSMGTSSSARRERTQTDPTKSQARQFEDQRPPQRYDEDEDEDMRDAFEDGDKDEEDQPSLHDDQTLGDYDIWREEADRSLEDSMENQRERLARSNKNQAGSGDEPGEEVQGEPRRITPFNNLPAPSPIPSLSDLLPEDTRPPRSKLPRTWRPSGRDDSLIYSDEAEGLESSAVGAGSMPPSARRDMTKGQQEQQESKKRKSFHFNGIGTPSQWFSGAAIPSVFKRWGQGSPGDFNTHENRPASGHAQAERSTVEPQSANGWKISNATPLSQHREPSKSPPKGILATPQRRRAEGTPAKEVHFQPDNVATTAEGEEQGRPSDSFRSANSTSSSSKRIDINAHDESDDDQERIDEPSFEESHDSSVSADLDATFIGRGQVSSSPLTHQGRATDRKVNRRNHSYSTPNVTLEDNSQVTADTSDIRQLRRETNASMGKVGTQRLYQSTPQEDLESETSETRQLRRDLRDLRDWEDLSSSQPSGSEPEESEQLEPGEHNDSNRDSSLLRPRKHYPKLFDGSSSTTAKVGPREQVSVAKQTKQVARAIASQPIASQPQKALQQTQEGLLSRLTSWLLPSIVWSGNSTSSGGHVRTQHLLWTQNHHWLLVHYYQHALWLESVGNLSTSSNTSRTGTQVFPTQALPPAGASLPACFFTRSLPTEWASHVGEKRRGIQSCKRGLPPRAHDAPGDEDYMCDPRLEKCEFGLPHKNDIDRDAARGIDVYKKYSSFEKTMNQTEVRVAYAFAHTVAEAGLQMWIADDAMKIGAVPSNYAKGPRLNEPVEDENGDLMRVKQHWWSQTKEGRAEAVGQVFTLWVAWILEERRRSSASM